MSSVHGSPAFMRPVPSHSEIKRRDSLALQWSVEVWRLLGTLEGDIPRIQSFQDTVALPTRAPSLDTKT